MKALTAALLAALLTACASALPDKPRRAAEFDLGLSASVAPAAAEQAPLPPLALPALTAPPALESPAMLYRLAYKGETAQPRPYAQSRWSMPPADLLGQRLRAALAASRPVVGEDEGLAALELRVHLDEFSQIFDSAEQSQARIQLRATLIDLHAARPEQRLRAQRSFSAQRPAPSADAAGGAQAMQQAADALIAELIEWLASVPPAPAAEPAAAPAPARSAR